MAQVVAAIPVAAANAGEEQRKQSQEPPPIKVNRTPPSGRALPSTPTFSTPPSDLELKQARVFEEPLVPIGRTTTADENTELAWAITTYVRAGGGEDVSAFEAFLAARPETPWRGSLLTDLGIVYRRTGYFSKALAAWEAAWEASKPAIDRTGNAIADRAVAELAELNARLGRFDRLEALFADIAGRDIHGSAGQKVAQAREGLAKMREEPGQAFRCGPMALDRIMAYSSAAYRPDPQIVEAKSTERGTSLAQVQALSAVAGLHLQMARRSLGAAPIVPAVVHWKAGHFAALVAEHEGRYLLQDPTFGDELWVTRKAIDEEASGYALVPSGSLPSGWRPVSADEGGGVWGKGFTTSNNNQNQGRAHVTQGGSPRCCPGSCPRMAEYRVHSMLVALNVTDEPVGYTPPRGGAVAFEVSYHQREVFQPQVPPFGNLGPNWTYDWLAFAEDDPANLNASVNIYLRGGGQETHNYDTGQGAYAPQAFSRTLLVRMSSSPIRYERRLPDGSVEVFAQSDGSQVVPRKVYLTSWADSQGNTTTLSYDGLKLTGITDAIGQVTTLSYELPGDPLKITKVTDPFGRFATFDYNPQGQLRKITDVIGITSEFTYGTADFITALTTPYGTTQFATGTGPDQMRWMEATDPLGGVERVEFRHRAPGVNTSEPSSVVPTGFPTVNSYLEARNTFFWDKRASALDPGHKDYKRAVITHWLHDVDINVASGIKESEKQPLENRVWYSYPQQVWSAQVGTFTAGPAVVGRVLDDGTTQLYRYEYNAKGKKIKETDPVGRETVYVYGTGSTPDPDQATGTGIDLLQVKQKNGGSYDVLQSSTYNAQHEPLTTTDAAGQTTTYTYLSDGRLQTVVTPPRAGLSAAERTTTYAYYSDNAPTGAGRFQTITGPSTPQGLPVTSFTYDGYGRVRTVTDPDNYALTYDYDLLDRPTKTTYPDATYEETVYNRLDAERQRDRLGRWTHTFYDALRRPVATRDPLGRTVTQQWCSCGSLDKLIDPNGNAASWERDLQGRVTKEIRADSSTREYTYEATTSRLKKVKDAKLQEIQYSYFLDDRLQQISYLNPQVATPNVSFTYDPAFQRMATVADGTGTTNFGYHPIGSTPPLGAGRLASVDGPYANDAISYGYDELGRVASRTLNGVTSTWSYDALGRLASQGDPIGAFTYVYDGTTSRLQTLTYPNAQTTTYTYLPNADDHRLQEIHHRTAGGVTLSRFAYAYDAVGNIKTWTQQYGSTANAYDIGYDPADQITSAAYHTTDPTPTVLKRYAYAYDPTGNRTTEEIDDTPTASTYNNMNWLMSQDGGRALDFKGTVNEQATVTVQGKPGTVGADNRFAGKAQVVPGTNTVAVVATDPSGNTRTNTYQVGISAGPKTFGYDANGSLTSNGTKTYEWNGESRLTRVLDGGSEIARFSYDGFGHRAQKVVGGVTRTYIYDGDDILEERLSTGSTIRYLHGPGIDRPLASVDGAGTISYYLADHLGSIVQTTNSSAVVTLTRQYDAYGNQISGSTASGYAFTGREWDAETGLYYYRARYYDATLGRFLSPDPAGLLGGVNPFVYVQNRPSVLDDPFGLAPSSTDDCEKERLKCIAPRALILGAMAGLCFIGCRTNPVFCVACIAALLYFAKQFKDTCDQVKKDCEERKRRKNQAQPTRGLC